MGTLSHYQSGQTIAGRYRLEGLLGEGGFGSVFRARQAPLDRPVAVKICHANAADPVACRRFEREARIIGRLRSPHTVRLYDFGLTVERHPFFAMELIRGHALDEELARGPLTPRRTAAILAEVCESLAEAHDVGVVHLDLKASNVMLERIAGRGEIARVLDFGISRMQADPHQTSAELRGLLGTPRYMAPEQFYGEPTSPQTDLFGLGLLLDECLRGAPTFPDNRQLFALEQRFANRPPPPEGPAPLRALIDHLLQRDPHNRPASASAVRDVLNGWMMTQTLECPAVSPALSEHEDLTLPDGGISIEPLGPGILGADLGMPGDPTQIPVHLPRHTSAFIGRQAQLSALDAAFAEEDARLVTLLGTGGAGKSRLAVHYAETARESFPGGLWFCELMEARSMDGIGLDVAAAFEMPVATTEPVAAVGSMLALRGRVLVILDNFEQVVEHAAATIGVWRRCAPEACFLVTSRSPLRLADEQVIPVPPIKASDAVALFAARVERVTPSFQLTPANRVRVEAIVAQLDYLPLAIELAAARMSMLSLEQLESRLASRFRLLRRRGVAVDDRQGNMYSAIAWSWDLLEPVERLALAQCAVFRGGFSLVDAEALLDVSAIDPEIWVEEVLGSLVDKTLVRRWATGGGRLRFGLYESIRAFARDKLDDPETMVGVDGSRLTGPAARAALRRRHAVHFSAWGTSQALRRLDVRGGPEVYQALEEQQENLLAAFEQAMESGHTGDAAHLSRALCAIYYSRGPLRLGLEVVERVLARPDLDPVMACAVRLEGSSLSIKRGGHEEALGYLSAVERSAVAASPALYVRTQLGLAACDLVRGRVSPACRHLRAALEVARESGDRVYEGRILLSLARTTHRKGDLSEAEAQYGQVLEITRDIGDVRTEIGALLGLGTYYDDLGRPDEAEAAYQAVIAPAKACGDLTHEAGALTNLALLYQVQGRWDESRRYARAAMNLFLGTGHKLGLAITHGNLGDLDYEMGAREDARRSLLAVIPTLDACDPMAAGAFRSTLALICAEEGDFEGAYAYLEAGEAQLASSHGPDYGKIRCRRGIVDLHRGDLEAARRHLAEATAIFESVGATDHSELGRALADLRVQLEGVHR